MGEPLKACEKDVEFDFDAAEKLESALSLFHDYVEMDHGDRESGLQLALGNWTGRAAFVFPDRVRVGITDGQTLSGYLTVADPMFAAPEPRATT